ncbi:hypothetical protein PFICI_07571 [Pestalotiopsis fici W106-1]|uniref:Nicotinamide N-methyltransferase n=1 Tax=Pestalotiopsis fici (strain W106-1 / CGMCC3.15140) TaxID=1229662 RepID=W3X3Q1_PESFW|nr:uncharacterized protein PFICI_07571 [Pestalotiopsis fici W106-1]ETS80042.1 hypothetical protein PFICI_07571 [Pestalotiopsis fici W106-1]
MSLTQRLTSVTVSVDPEDFLGESLGVIFPDDVTTQHGDAANALRYTSPHLPKPFHIRLADPDTEDERRLFSHYLWNASLLLAEFVEAGSLGLKLDKPLGCGASAAGDDTGDSLPAPRPGRLSESSFDVGGLSTIELGSGTALPSIMAAVLSASRVAATDYPAPPIMEILRTNVSSNTQAAFAPVGRSVASSVVVEGHAWGEVSSEAFAAEHRGRFDRVLACDCLWMPWQHDNLRRSIEWFLSDDGNARAWLVAGFHTGRHNMSGFFDTDKLAAAGLELESIWERDVEGEERDWAVERLDDGNRKRWLVVASLKKLPKLQS